MSPRFSVLPIIATAVFAVLLLTAFSVRGATGLSGAALFQQHGCSGCHSIGGAGGAVGPALDNVGERFTGQWLYEWLRDPDAVKPGTEMPNFDLSGDERALLVFYLMTLNSDGDLAPVAVSRRGDFVVDPPDLRAEAPENDYLDLGVDESYIDQQRYSLQDQIQSFIPPVYESAITGTAFVLPPGALRTTVVFRDVRAIDEDDFSGQTRFGSRLVDLDVKRRFVDFDAFLGLDNNLTLRVNIPFSSTTMSAAINPAFNDMVTIFPHGSVVEVGDITVFLKKKFLDQGNFPIGIAAMAAVRLPTGSNKELFDPRTTANVGGMDMLLPLPAVDDEGMVIPGTADGTFRRFSNDGRLPAPLQPGLGTLGATVGLFGTRILEGYSLFGRGAVHAGALFELRPASDGIDPGNQVTAFATVVKPVIGDWLSFDLSYIFKHQGEDSYKGKILVPTAMGPMIVDRPPFSGGNTQLVGTSFVITPNPLYRVTLSGLYRVGQPRLGPSPKIVIRAALTYTFATGLFQ